MRKTRLGPTLALAVGLLALPDPGVAQAQDAETIARGARLYSQTCGRCHNPRAATERTDREWAIIMGHMRSRANLTKSAANAILAFLQMANLPESAQAAVPPVAPGPGTAPAPAAGEGVVQPPGDREDEPPGEGGDAEATSSSLGPDQLQALAAWFARLALMEPRLP